MFLPIVATPLGLGLHFVVLSVQYRKLVLAYFVKLLDPVLRLASVFILLAETLFLTSHHLKQSLVVSDNQKSYHTLLFLLETKVKDWSACSWALILENGATTTRSRDPQYTSGANQIRKVSER